MLYKVRAKLWVDLIKFCAVWRTNALISFNERPHHELMINSWPPRGQSCFKCDFAL